MPHETTDARLLARDPLADRDEDGEPTLADATTPGPTLPPGEIGETLALPPTEPESPAPTTAATEIDPDPGPDRTAGSLASASTQCETIAEDGHPTPTQAQTLGPDDHGPESDRSHAGQSASWRRFRVLNPHARGGLGEVFLAFDEELNREVALKAIQDRHADRADCRARFLIEAEVTGALEHPGIVPVYSLGRDPDGRPFYAMRFIRGDGLDRAIRAFHADGGLARGHHALEFRQLLRRFVDVCNTIAFAHSRRVVHRDLKPSNVMLGPYGETLVVDWGLAKRLDLPDGESASGEHHALSGATATAQTLPGTTSGTPSFMSPEQAMGRLDELGPASDIYSLGATLYVLLTGRETYPSGRVSEILGRARRGDFERPRAIDRAIPAPLEAICQKAMALRPEDRYASARDLAGEIEHWMADEPVAAYPEPWRDRLMRWGRRHRTWTQAGAAALAAVAVVAVVSALLVAAARRDEQAARVREDRHRLVSERLDRERREHLQATRVEGEAHFLKGKDALDRGDWPAARLQLARALAMTRAEPELDDLAARAERLRRETEQQLAAHEAHARARDTYERFLTRRDDALFHGTLFTGLDPAANLAASVAAAREALALCGMADDASTTPAPAGPGLGPEEQEEIRTGCYEMLLVLADAEALPRADLAPEDRRGRARRALRVLDRAAALGGSTRSFHARRARYLDQAVEAEAAREESARAAAIEPTTAVDRFLLGEEQYWRGAPDRAIHDFEQALRLRPDHFWAQYFLAACHLKADPPRPAEAKAHLTACLARRPGFTWIYLLRGYALGELGEYEAAEADFLRALGPGKDAGVRYGVLVNRGGTRVRRGAFEKAIADLNEAIALKPDQHQAYANLGLALGGLKRWDEAIGRLDEAIRLAPGQAALHRNRALVHLGRGDLDAALRDFDEAIRLAPGPGRSLARDQVERGRLLHRRGDHAGALAAYDAALKLRPDDRGVERLRAEALLALGRGGEALDALNRVLDPAEPDPDAYRKRGFERAKAADPAGALADFTRALAAEPDSPSTRARRGWGFLNESSKLALRDFEAAIKLDPANGDLYGGRGYARVLLGDTRGAVADAEESLRLLPPAADLRAHVSSAHNAACIYAQAAAKAAFLADPDERQALTRRYQDRAVALIRQALDRLPAPARAPFLKQASADPALDPIRSYRPFEELGAGAPGR